MKHDLAERILVRIDNTTEALNRLAPVVQALGDLAAAIDNVADALRIDRTPLMPPPPEPCSGDCSAAQDRAAAGWSGASKIVNPERIR
jgi:hypothetical protein